MKIHHDVPNPQLLTPKALRLARGELVLKLTDADLESWLSFEQRMEAVDLVQERVEQFIKDQPTSPA